MRNLFATIIIASLLVQINCYVYILGAAYGPLDVTNVVRSKYFGYPTTIMA